jgi:4-amino-4-deoxy-L-arabinose transferase-like glycosyltransferase
MLGVGLLLVLYLVGRRFGPARLAADQRSRFLLVWTLPPLLVYVLAHLGEPGYVLSLAPQAALLIALACFDLSQDCQRAAEVLRARGWRWLPDVKVAVTALLALTVIAWNIQAFARGVGPGRLPDLRAHDSTTAAQVQYLQQLPQGTTLVLAHDILRQLAYYLPGTRVELLYSEYVPNFSSARARTELPAGTQQVVILDEIPGAQEVVLSQHPRVSVWVLDARGARAIEHGYRFAQLEPAV